jgi:hypothetical protein
MSIEVHWLQWTTLAGEFDDEQEVVGESFRQEALRALSGGSTTEGVVNRVVTAEMIREPENAHDPNAVRVEVGGMHVGYLPREDAAGYHMLLAEFKAAGIPATCRARLTGGWYRGPDDSGFIGVVLIGCRRWRSASDPFLPGERLVSVNGEEEHQELISGLLPGPFLAEVGLGKDLQGSTSRLEVSHHGNRLGTLSRLWSERYEPLVRRVRNVGFPPTCIAEIERGTRKLELKLRLPEAYATRPASVPQQSSLSWLPAPAAPAGWFIDPTGRHQLRYWNGACWTEHVGDEGAQSVDAGG